MYYTRDQYRAYISALRRSRRRKRIKPISLFALLVVLAGGCAVLQGNRIPWTGEGLGLQQANADSGRSPQRQPTKSLWDEPAANPAARCAWDQKFGSLLRETTFTVSSGDTLINILRKAGLARREAYEVIRTLKKIFNPAELKRGHELTLGFIDTKHTDPVFHRLCLKTDFDREYQVVRRVDQGFSARKVNRRLQVRPARAEAEITSSLYQAAMDAGLPVKALMQVLRAYSYDVDFQRDIRPGDSIEVLYEEKLDDKGQVVASGAVLFAVLHTRGRSLRIYRHKNADGGWGFYNTEGKSVRKALMVTPIEGARISSGYGMRRHPISGYNKMHEGLDFAAPRGVPVMTAGDGVVEYAGRRGSYGNYVRIRHPNQYKTIYAHLNGYAENIKSGVRVRQGETIGYVGSTGRSTGPHLHYEVMYAGNPVNPSRMETPPGRTLEGKELEKFLATKAEMEKLYASLAEDTKLAFADQDSKKKVKTTPQ
ncbi:MAG: M23 family metallopeptidase [Desulfobacteraceae bacterium]|nr:M23 family metallopeptidase [Desulfobacteraceae bacterium]